MIVRCAAGKKLQNLIGDVYQSQGQVIEVKPLRTRLEDLFVEAVSARDDNAVRASRQTGDTARNR